MALKLAYWEDYGGWRAVWNSRWFWLSVVATACLWPIWTEPGWWEPVLTIAPNLMGYALGGFAIFLGVGTDGFQEFLSGPGKLPVSPLRAVASSFCHFIVVSTLALGFAVASDTYYVTPPESVAVVFEAMGAWFDVATYAVWGLSWLVFIYAMALAVATANNLMHYTGWLDRFLAGKKDQRSQTTALTARPLLRWRQSQSRPAWSGRHGRRK